jgi:cell division transport system ATP-binding protein
MDKSASPSVSTPVVSLQGVAVFQEQNRVLSGVNLEIAKGEFVYLVGRTGGGKSSLLKTIYADLPIRDGEASICGYNLRSLPARRVHLLRRKLGIVFQDFQLFFDRSVGENLVFVMKATGWTDSSKIKARLTDVLMQVGLSNIEGKMPHQLSGGEQQRVVIARALINEPLLMIADEPTGNLDPEVSRGIMQIFKQINNSGTAVLMATHNHYLIREYAGRVLQVADGTLLPMEASQVAATLGY